MTVEADRLADSRSGWLAVKGATSGIGPGLIRQSRANYEADLLARIEQLMNARADTPQGHELRALADEWIAHEVEYPHAPEPLAKARGQ